MVGMLHGQARGGGESRGSRAGGIERAGFKECSHEVKGFEFGTAHLSKKGKGRGVDAGVSSLGPSVIWENQEWAAWIHASDGPPESLLSPNTASLLFVKIP